MTVSDAASTDPDGDDLEARPGQPDRCVLDARRIEPGDERPSNTFVLAGPDGSVHRYRKIHPFSMAGEPEHFESGNEVATVDVEGVRVTPLICYDLRFPAWCRHRGDYDLMLLVANWPIRRIHHWDTLLEARAIENQSWVVGVNRTGRDSKGLKYPGHSVVHGPMGETLVKMDDSEGCALVEMELEAVMKARDRFPFQSDADTFEIV